MPLHATLRVTRHGVLSPESVDKHSEALAGALLIGASALYEGGEYAIHNEELRETGGDESKINLVWSAQDTIFDLMSNTLGWLVAALLRSSKSAARKKIVLK